jgi:hypothetical protein
MQGVFHILTFFYTEKITKEKQVNATWYIVVQDDKLNSGFGPSPFDRPDLMVTIQHMVHIFQSISNQFNKETECSWNSGTSKNEINCSVYNSKLHFKKFYSPTCIWVHNTSACPDLHLATGLQIHITCD